MSALEGLAMSLHPDDIHSLTDFKRHTLDHLKQLARTGRPRVLTVNGRAKIVVQDAAAYQKLMETIDRTEAIEGIKRGLADVKAGRVSTIDEARVHSLRRLKARRRA
jgi:prevent-host-death family protein